MRSCLIGVSYWKIMRNGNVDSVPYKCVIPDNSVHSPC